MSRALRVLIVDDEVVVASTLAQILKLKGSEPLAVHRGEEAVRAVSTFRPDAAIIDVLMPDLNGIEVALAIRQLLPTCRIVLFSGNHEASELLDKAAADGHYFEILAKPAHPLTVLDALGPIPCCTATE